MLAQYLNDDENEQIMNDDEDDEQNVSGHENDDQNQALHENKGQIAMGTVIRPPHLHHVERVLPGKHNLLQPPTMSLFHQLRGYMLNKQWDRALHALYSIPLLANSWGQCSSMNEYKEQRVEGTMSSSIVPAVWNILLRLIIELADDDNVHNRRRALFDAVELTINHNLPAIIMFDTQRREIGLAHVNALIRICFLFASDDDDDFDTDHDPLLLIKRLFELRRKPPYSTKDTRPTIVSQGRIYEGLCLWLTWRRGVQRDIREKQKQLGKTRGGYILHAFICCIPGIISYELRSTPQLKLAQDALQLLMPCIKDNFEQMTCLLVCVDLLHFLDPTDDEQKMQLFDEYVTLYPVDIHIIVNAAQRFNVGFTLDWFVEKHKLALTDIEFVSPDDPLRLAVIEYQTRLLPSELMAINKESPTDTDINVMKQFIDTIESLLKFVEFGRNRCNRNAWMLLFKLCVTRRAHAHTLYTQVWLPHEKYWESWMQVCVCENVNELMGCPLLKLKQEVARFMKQLIKQTNEDTTSDSDA